MAGDIGCGQCRDDDQAPAVGERAPLGGWHRWGVVPFLVAPSLCGLGGQFKVGAGALEPRVFLASGNPSLHASGRFPTAYSREILAAKTPELYSRNGGPRWLPGGLTGHFQVSGQNRQRQIRMVGFDRLVEPFGKFALTR